MSLRLRRFYDGFRGPLFLVLLLGGLALAVLTSIAQSSASDFSQKAPSLAPISTGSYINLLLASLVGHLADTALGGAFLALALLGLGWGLSVLARPFTTAGFALLPGRTGTRRPVPVWAAPALMAAVIVIALVLGAVLHSVWPQPALTASQRSLVDQAAIQGFWNTVAQLQTGLQKGAIYALIAVGYTLVYGIIELINFAHGDVFTMSAFYAFFVAQVFHLDTLAASGGFGLVLALVIVFPVSMLLAGATGVVIERVAYRPLRHAPRLAPLITAIGVSFLLEGIMFAFFIPGGSFGSIGGQFPTNKGAWIGGVAFRMGPGGSIAVGWKDIFVVGCAILFMVALSLVIRFTTLGKAMRATAQDRDAAQVCGININRTIAATFFIGSALAAAAAIIYSIDYNLVQWNLGYRFGIVAFTAAVLGGIGNIIGAGLGGFMIGIVEVMTTQIWSGSWSDPMIFAVLIIVLIVKPNGLLGMQVADRA